MGKMQDEATRMNSYSEYIEEAAVPIHCSLPIFPNVSIIKVYLSRISFKVVTAHGRQIINKRRTSLLNKKNILNIL